MLADDVLCTILDEVKSAQYYSIMVDETMDCNRKEQMAICFRYCDDNLNTYELFAGFHELVQQDALPCLKLLKIFCYASVWT
jgi:hypothetical protein